MSKRRFVLLATLFLAPKFVPTVAAQSPASYLPPVAAAKAAKYISAIDQAMSGIAARRQSAREAETAAETQAIEAFALISASRSGHGPWASPDGSAKSSDSSAAFDAARTRAKAAASALSAGDDGSAQFAASRDGAAQSLAQLILGSGIAGKAAVSRERSLYARSKDLGLFPEILEIEDTLRRSGSAGARLAAAAFSFRSAEAVALALIASKSRILEIVPEAAGPLARLELVSRAYRSWISGFAVAAYPGDIASASDLGKTALVAGVSAFVAIKPDRAWALVEAMLSTGDGRDAAAARSARRFSDAWSRSSEARRRDLASACGLPESTLASFSTALAPRFGGAAGSVASHAADPLAAAQALNALAVDIADEEESGGAFRGPEPALILLTEPTLAKIARAEPRYANLFAEASRRLGSIYSQAAEDACAKLEASPSLAKAAALALGGGAISLSVHAFDLRLGPEESGRRLAFVATAASSTGSSLSLPLDATEAGQAYAKAFATVAGLSPNGLVPNRFLAKYGQWVVAAYDPESSDGSLIEAVFPDSTGGPSSVGELELELAISGGWRP
jgi:hypothetical protein